MKLTPTKRAAAIAGGSLLFFLLVFGRLLLCCCLSVGDDFIVGLALLLAEDFHTDFNILGGILAVQFNKMLTVGFLRGLYKTVDKGINVGTAKCGSIIELFM